MQTRVHDDKKCRDVEGIPSHPRDRLVIIGGSDSEHDSLSPRREIAQASAHKNRLEKPHEAAKITVFLPD